MSYACQDFTYGDITSILQEERRTRIALVFKAWNVEQKGDFEGYLPNKDFKQIAHLKRKQIPNSEKSRHKSF